MDEAAIEKAGTRPLEKGLDEIAALKRTRRPGAASGAAAPGVYRLGRLFGFGSNQDFADSEQVIAFAGRRRPGPARPRLLRQDRRQIAGDARALSSTTWPACCGLLGDAPATARAEAATVMAIETELAKASLTRVEQRDPYKLFHKLSQRRAGEADAAFRLAGILANASGLPAPAVINVTEPEVLRRGWKNCWSRRAPPPIGRPICAGTW